MKGLACLAAQHRLTINYAAKKCLRVLTGLYRCVLSGQCIVTSVPMLGTMPGLFIPASPPPPVPRVPRVPGPWSWSAAAACTFICRNIRNWLPAQPRQAL